MSPHEPTSPIRHWSLGIRPFLLALGLVGMIPISPAAADEADDSLTAAAVGGEVVREAADYSYRRWLRNRIWSEDDESRYGLQFEKGWRKAAAKSPELPLVVLVHGFNSNPQRNAAVMVPISGAGFPTASFAYPNDWDLRESSALLSRQLKQLAKDHPEQKITLITHSMGGLVARACIENDELDPGNVKQIVMIAPPSQGTALAHLAIATDVWEHWLDRDEGGCWTRWRDSVVDGLGEAADDLVPGSAFLTELNARPRNANVRYSLFLGTGAAVDEGEMKWIRSTLMKLQTVEDCPGLRRCSGKLGELLEDMEEIVDGKGDGVVAVKRGRLDGVDDVVILPFGHLNCTGKPDRQYVRQLQEELLARLQ